MAALSLSDFCVRRSPNERWEKKHTSATSRHRKKKKLSIHLINLCGWSFHCIEPVTTYIDWFLAKIIQTVFRLNTIFRWHFIYWINKLWIKCVNNGVQMNIIGEIFIAVFVHSTDLAQQKQQHRWMNIFVTFHSNNNHMCACVCVPRMKSWSFFNVQI